MRAVIYRRISLDATGEEAGVTRQAYDCRRYCKQRGWRVVADLEDNDISASRYTRKRRPAYQQAIRLIEDGDADALVAYHLDRLWRRPSELEHLIDLTEKRKIVVATLNGDIDLNTGDGRFQARILVSVSAKASDDQSRRERARFDADAREGKPRPGGPTPFGYLPDKRRLDPATVPLVREMVRRVIAGDSCYQVAQDLNARGEPNPKGGKEWTATTVKAIVGNPRIAGLRVHRGVVVGAGDWDRIVTDLEWKKLRAVLDDPTRRMKDPPRRRMLTGLVFCGRCHRPLTYSHPTQLICVRGPGHDGCGKLAVSAARLEELVALRTFDWVERRPMGKRSAATDTPLLADIDRLKAQRDDLADMWARQELTREEWARARANLRAQLAAAESAAAGEVRRGAVLRELGSKRGELRRRWSDLPDERRRRILAAVIDQVTVEPVGKAGPWFRPERVSITWR